MGTNTAALTYLRTALSDPNADFRDGQWECIRDVMEGQRLLVVQRTGWGKSMVYFIATRMLRDQGKGPTLLVSPLLSLMRNQEDAAQRIGLNPASIHSQNVDEWPSIVPQVCDGIIDILMISPERLANESFRSTVLMPIAASIGLLVVDEVHCISDWGHDFRPDYRRISRIMTLLPRNLPVLATTATANDRVVEDVADQIGNVQVHRGPLTRQSLRLQNIVLPNAASRLAWLCQTLPTLPGSGIIYTLTTRDANRVALYLRWRGISAQAYHARLDDNASAHSREELEDMLLRNEIKALVATVSLGMGFDKPDLGFVIHYQRPASVIHYYQQVGRAGRAVDLAYGILLGGKEDDTIAEYFAETAFPPQEHMQLLIQALEDSRDGLTSFELLCRLNIPKNHIEKALRILAAEDPAPVIRERNKWVRTPVPWYHDQEKITHLKAIRRHEQKEMAEYMKSEECLMLQLSRSLDDPHAEPCGRCENCVGSPVIPTQVAVREENRAIEFFKNYVHFIQPRTRWPMPPAFPAFGFVGEIPDDQRAETGRALCAWGDPVWGELIRDGKYKHNHFDDALVDACIAMLQRKPFPQQPAWVTCVPSRSRPTLVSDFASRLARRLHLPFSEAVIKDRDSKPQKEMMNSWHQARNLDGAFRILPRSLHHGPVMLVDDMVDSRWTMTVIAARLKMAAQHYHVNMPAVLPLALALSTSHES